MTRSDSMLSRLLSLSARGAALTALWSLLVVLHSLRGLSRSTAGTVESGRSIDHAMDRMSRRTTGRIIRRLAPFPILFAGQFWMFHRCFTYQCTS